MRVRLIGVVTILALCTPAVAGPGTPPPARAPTPADPLDRPWFTASPAELLAAARAATATDHDVVVLREDVIVSYDERGRADERRRVIFAVLTPKGADDWGPISLGWAPFYQDKPTVRARVIAPDGTVAELDPSLVHDAPTVRESPVVYSDRRDLQAPLPRLSVGAVVEEEFTFRDREPLLAAGSVDWHAIRRGVPIGRKRITIASPKARPVTVVVRGPGAVGKPRTTVEGARTVVTFDLTDVAPADDDVVGAPSDHVVDDWIGISTGKSWAAVADDYRALVERQLASGATLPAEVRGPTPRATVDRALAWLHGRVRYTGIELSDSAIMPATPAETLARGFGDCKDKATLLVSLLRSAGITADVVLLTTGPGWDADPALPGMGGFDHAIVRAVVDGKPVWIDATEDLLPAGELPTRDQDRRVLIIAAGTKGLTPTPATAPADNELREERIWHLAEHAWAKVTEIKRPTGGWSSSSRSNAAATSADDTRKGLADYARRVYDGELTRYSQTDPSDLSIPYTLTLELADVHRAGYQRDRLDVWLSPYAVLSHVPDIFTDTGAEADAEAERRRVDFVWNFPFVYEIAHRLELPPGYTPPDLPARETRALGPLTLTTTRARTATTLSITYRLDTGKRRITADELRAARTAIAALRDEDAHHIVLDSDAHKLLDQDKPREAIAELTRLAKLHPKEALHHSQLAMVYLDLGMGDAARREARLGTTVEPDSGDGWAVLGAVLRVDPVGRSARPGADRAGAEAALRKALAVRPSHVGARLGLVELLTTDEHGHHEVDPRRLTAALELLRAPDAKNLPDRDESLIDLLGRLGDADGLAALDGSIKDATLRRQARALAIALRDGGAAARRAIEASAPTRERDAVIGKVASALIELRRYDALRELRGHDLDGNRVTAETMKRLRAVEPGDLPATDPRAPVVTAFRASLLGAPASPPWSKDVAAALAAEREQTLQVLRSQRYPLRSSLDFSLAAIELRVDGDARTFWRVTATTAQVAPVYYLVERKGRPWLIGSTAAPIGVGREIQAALARRDLPRARAMASAMVRDLGDKAAGVVARHRDELASADARLLALVAATLLGGDDARVAAEAAPIVAGCGGLTAADDVVDCHGLAGDLYYRADDYVASAREGRLYLAAHPDSRSAAKGVASALALAGQRDEAVAVLEAALVRSPGDDELGLRRAEIGLADPWPVARARFEALAADASPDRTALNNAAWTYLYHDPTPAAAMALVDRARLAFPSATHSEANTYAAVMAESDRPAEAWKQLGPFLDDTAEVSSADWYVLGRIAEGLGLRDDAIAAYRRVEDKHKRYIGVTSHQLAGRRLRALGVAP